jgi:hypothetical protein
MFLGHNFVSLAHYSYPAIVVVALVVVAGDEPPHWLIP